MKKQKKISGYPDADRIAHTTRYDPKVFNALSKYCEEHFLSLSWMVNEIVKRHFEEEP